jgi:hypothetical protein
MIGKRPNQTKSTRPLELYSSTRLSALSGATNRRLQPALPMVQREKRPLQSSERSLEGQSKRQRRPTMLSDPIIFPPRTHSIKTRTLKRVGPWSEHEKLTFLRGLLRFGWGQWKAIESVLTSRCVRRRAFILEGNTRRSHTSNLRTHNAMLRNPTSMKCANTDRTVKSLATGKRLPLAGTLV